jgi:hypothetical protein
VNEAEIYVTIADDRIKLVLPGDGWTSDEAKLAKTVSEGMAPVTIEENLMLMDPDAWLAVLRVSYVRAEKEFPAAAVAGTNMVDLMKSVADAIREAMKDRPPTSRQANGTSAPGEKHEDASLEDSSSERTTSGTSGVPT